MNRKNPDRPKLRPFDRSRNAEKRDNWRHSIIERCARRKLASWKRETRNLDMKRVVLGQA